MGLSAVSNGTDQAATESPRLATPKSLPDDGEDLAGVADAERFEQEQVGDGRQTREAEQDGGELNCGRRRRQQERTDQPERHADAD